MSKNEDKDSENFLSKNLRYLRTRNKPKLSQQDLGNKLGEITRSAISSYEDGRAEPRLDLLLKIASYFKVTVDQLLNHDLEKLENSELVRKEEVQKYVSGEKMRVLTVPTDPETDEEQVVLVPQKARAGYSMGYSDESFFKDLPKYHLPFLDKSRTYRAFEITGDSMPPVKSGDIVIGEFIEDWHLIKDGTFAVVTVKGEGFVLKKVYNKIGERNTLLLRSTNMAYEPYEVNVEDIIEVWRFSAVISKQFPEESMNNQNVSYNDLKEKMWELQNEVKEIKRKIEL